MSFNFKRKTIDKRFLTNYHWKTARFLVEPGDGKSVRPVDSAQTIVRRRGLRQWWFEVSEFRQAQYNYMINNNF